MSFCYDTCMPKGNPETYDFSAFDDSHLRFISKLRSHVRLWYPAIAGIFLISFSGYHLVFFIFGIASFVLCFYLLRWSNITPGDIFARQNGLTRPFMTDGSYYYFLYKEYKEAADSALSKTSATPWGLPMGTGELGITFFNNLDVLVWGRLSKNFPHLVIDATGNDRFFGNNIEREQLPVEQVSLEGDFPQYFRVYMEKGQQILSLQILSPDRMVNLIDKLPRFDLEIKGNHIKLYGVNMQRNSGSMKALLDILRMLDHDLKMDRLNKTKVV